MVKEIANYKEFKALLASTKTKYIFVDFYAQWCGPCKRIAPDIAKLADKMPHITFCKVDIEAVPKMGEKYSIGSLPTFILFDTVTKKPLGTQVIGAKLNEINNLLNSVAAPKLNIQNDF